MKSTLKDVSILLLFCIASMVMMAVFSRLLWSAPMPDAALTPGAVDPVVTQAVVCGTSTKGRRHTSEATKKKVFQIYGIPYSEHAGYEVDHLISLELGGLDNDTRNLWPEAYEPRPGAHEKDLVENKLHRMVCRGEMSLSEAQHLIATDWLQAYTQYVKGKKSK